MSLYNAMFGYNPLTPLVLEALQLHPGQIPRFRDAFYNSQEDYLVIYTRTGGGNRGYYGSRDGYDNEGYEGPFNEDLENHPMYLFDEDDDFDSTYAYFYFQIPTEFKPIFETFKELNAGKDLNPSEKFKKLMEDLHNGNTTEETDRALKYAKSMLETMFGVK